MARQAYETLRVGGNSLNDRLVKTNPDGKLNEHRTQAAKRVNTLFPVELHGLLRSSLPIALMLLLDLLHHGLKRAHGLDLAALLHRKRDHHEPDQQSEGNYRNTEVSEQVVVEQDQPVDHRLDDHEGPCV